MLLNLKLFLIISYKMIILGKLYILKNDEIVNDLNNYKFFISIFSNALISSFAP